MPTDPHKALDQALTYTNFLRSLAMRAGALPPMPTRQEALSLKADGMQAARYVDLQENVLLEGLVGSFGNRRHVTAIGSSLHIPDLSHALVLLNESKERVGRTAFPSREET